jgi:hypothetical protein
MKHVEELPTDTYIASNAEDIIYLLTGRDTSLVPAKYNVFSLVSNRAYSEEIGELKEKLRNGGRVVWFREVTWREGLPTEDELREGMDLRVVAREDDGTVYAG